MGNGWRALCEEANVKTDYQLETVCAVTQALLAGRSGFKSRLWENNLVLINRRLFFFKSVKQKW